MTENMSLMNIGELSKPATALIEKVSDALGGIFKPWQIRRVALAEAEAEKIRVLSQIEVTELQYRAFQRMIVEEAKTQNIIEEITIRALPLVEEGAHPETIEDDWILNFYDKCRLFSNNEMQTLWSKVLAGEANTPGSYSRRTVNILGSLEKSDAFLFQSLCGFGWFYQGIEPLIFDVTSEIYINHEISFDSLKHLDDIGLIYFSSIGTYSKNHLPKKIRFVYYNKPIDIEFKNEKDNCLEVGLVYLTKTGQELAPICGSKPIPEFFDFIVEKWKNRTEFSISTPVICEK